MPDQNDIVLRLSKAQKHQGAFFPGVPLRDLTQADLDALPEHVRLSVEASDLYYVPKVRATAADDAPEEEEVDDNG